MTVEVERCRNVGRSCSRRIWLLFISIALLAAIPGCRRRGEEGAAVVPMEERGGGIARPKVIGTTTIVADLVELIGGSAIELTGLIPAGRDPHRFELTAEDVFELRTADLIFYNGLNLEGEVESKCLELSGEGVKAIAVTGRIPRERLIVSSDDNPDPHVWGDPLLWAECVPVVADALKELLPKESAAIDGRVDSYLFYLRALDEWIKGQVERVPWSDPNRRIVVISHDAFAYWARAYKFDIVSLTQSSAQSEVAASEITRVADLVKGAGLPVVFEETNRPRAAMLAVAHEARARVGPEIYSDSLGSDFSPHFSVRLLKVPAPEALPDAGIGHIFIGRLPNGSIHLRVFGNKGLQIYDRAERDVASNRLRLRELKELLSGMWSKDVIEDDEEVEVESLVKEVIDYVPPSKAGGSDPGPERAMAVPGEDIDVRTYIGMMKYNTWMIAGGLKDGLRPGQLTHAAEVSKTNGVAPGLDR